MLCREISPETIVFRTSMPVEQIPTSFNDEDLWLRVGKFGIRLPSKQRLMNISSDTEIGKCNATKSSKIF
jgi:hypothetical protein